MCDNANATEMAAAAAAATAAAAQDESFALKRYEEARKALFEVHKVQLAFFIGTLIASVLDEKNELVMLTGYWEFKPGWSVFYTRSIVIASILLALIVTGLAYARWAIYRIERSMQDAGAILDLTPEGRRPRDLYFAEGRSMLSRARLNTWLLFGASLLCFVVLIDLPEHLFDRENIT